MNDRQEDAQRTSLQVFGAEVSTAHVLNAVVAFLFAVTGPIAIMLTVGVNGGMSGPELSSWMFGAFTLNGLISIGFCLWYRQPLVFLWSIPGIVLVGAALEHLRFPEVVGAYYATGILLVVLGLSGWLKRISSWLPMPIVMGMVGGVFLRFGVDWIKSFEDGFWIAAPMTVCFFAASAFPVFARRVPPVVVALIAGFVAMMVTGDTPPREDVLLEIVTPAFFQPEFSLRAMIELVIPLAITVVFVQNNQGVALLESAGHKPPVDRIAAFCGIGSLMAAVVGTVPSCLSGPVNGIISGDENRSGHYTAGVIVAVLLGLFGIMAPLFTSLILAAPAAFIATLGGIALLRILQSAFTSAFEGRLSMGGLVAFVVTVSQVSFLNVGAPFWGLVFGVITSWVVERADMRASARH